MNGAHAEIIYIYIFGLFSCVNGQTQANQLSRAPSALYDHWPMNTSGTKRHGAHWNKIYLNNVKKCIPITLASDRTRKKSILNRKEWVRLELMIRNKRRGHLFYCAKSLWTICGYSFLFQITLFDCVAGYWTGI